MSGGRGSGLLTCALRANPLYELVLFDGLEPAEREGLAELSQDPGFYGLLKPRNGAGLTVKSVDCDTALLFLTLREPGPLPLYARRAMGEGALRTVARLVADSVLEAQAGERWLSGPAAHGVLPAAGEGGGGRLAELSLRALRWAQTLPVDDPRLLAGRLYGYNRLPLSPRWKLLLPSADAVLDFLGVGPGGPWQDRLAQGWTRSRPSPGRSGWIDFRSRRPNGERSRQAVTYKLYVSPEPEALGTSFGAILEALEGLRASQLKVGSNALGLLRPDKMVVYFRQPERLTEAALRLSERLSGRLSGIPAQGVPFTSEIGLEGVLSWGLDPPRASFGGSRGESWRSWLTRRIARALLDARAMPSEGGAAATEPWRYALDRLSLEGVDPNAWMPRAFLWKAE